MMLQVVPSDLEWELVIVDNGSTDDTQVVMNSYRSRLPIKSVSAPDPGLSNARNAGVRGAEGEYIVWTDDDVILSSGWLLTYRNAFKRWSDAAVFGGKITPILEPPTPVWFARAIDDVGYLLGTRDFGNAPIPLSVDKEILPFGANYAIRAAVQKKFLYDPALGIAPGRRMGGEETDVVVRILNAGHTGWWLPGAEVKHITPTDRQSVDYISHYYEALGELTIHNELKDGGATLLIGGVPPILWIKLPFNWAKFHITHGLSLRCWVRYLTSYAFRKGMFKTWLAHHQSKRRQADLNVT
jgi:glycosyltransferase involved in cell wall biosynthesis